MKRTSSQRDSEEDLIKFVENKRLRIDEKEEEKVT